MIFMMQKPEIEVKYALSDEGTKSQCESRRQNNVNAGYQCVGKCWYISNAMELCFWDIGFREGHKFEDYGYVFDLDNKDASCECMNQDVIDQYNCMYSAYGDPPIVRGECGAGCNTDADRDCSGTITLQEILDALANIYGDTTYFSSGTFTSSNIGIYITGYYGAV